MALVRDLEEAPRTEPVDYTVTFYELHARTVTVKAKSAEEAYWKYYNGNYEGVPTAPEYADDHDFVSVCEESAKKYFRERCCPYCGKNGIEFGRTTFMEDSMYQVVSCQSCGREWDDIYRLVGICTEEDESWFASKAHEDLPALLDV